MMTVHFYPDRFRLEIEGHAEYAPHGQDVVCAAASMLFYTLARTLKAHEVTRFGFQQNVDAAIKMVECAPVESEKKGVQIIFDTIMNGFDLLAYNYPEYVDVRKEGTNA